MATQYLNPDTIKFLLFEVHGLEELFAYSFFEEFDKSSVNMMVDSAVDFADKELFPYFEEMDRVGVNYQDGKVNIHPQVYKVLKSLGQSGWIISTSTKEDGGIQLPQMVHSMAAFIYSAANNSGLGYATLTLGAARLLKTFGNKMLKENYMSKMYEGTWQGTMAMTEPQAGSSLSDIETKAIPQGDGTYKIKGQKIFISAGDYSDVDNVVHLMLVRIEGGPKGTRGISLLAVPKNRLTENGELVSNDVTTAGLFHKMGQHGYVTTHLVMGEQDDCIGYLVGKEHKGLSYMFQMMNAARIEVGLMAAAIATAAYYASLEYAKERPQGRPIDNKNPEEPPVTIIHHADVRRMLFLQKAVSEGSLSLITECARCIDMLKVTEGEEKHNYELLLEILTPIAKTYPTEMGIVSVSNGLQILGGYGYCADFPLEQLYRDIRIAALYEGTTGIQSIDLLGRKVIMEDGKALTLLLDKISSTIAQAKKFDQIKTYADKLEHAIKHYQKVVAHLKAIAQKGKTQEFLADANLFMELSGILIIGWQWLKMGTAALGNNKSHSEIFYKSKLDTLTYYFSYEIPKIEGLIQRLLEDQYVTIKGEEETLI